MKKKISFFRIAALLVAILSCSSCNRSHVAAGTYSGTEKGFGGDVTVHLTIDTNGKLSAVTINADHETPDIGQAAAHKMAESMVSKQTIAIDGISGASFTSKAVLAAAARALKQSGSVSGLSQKNKGHKSSDETITVSVLVAGAGGAGTAAALAAAEAGEKVLILEKLPSYGGNSRLASGFFAVDSRLQRARGMHLSEDTAVTRLLEFNQYLSNGPLTRAIVHNAADTVEWLSGYGMTFHLQEKTTQFAHEGDPYEAYSYHKYDNSSQGFDNLYLELKKRGAELRTNTTVTDLILDESGAVTGVQARKEDGSMLTVHANAVIIATGGFGGNEERVKKQMHTSYLNCIGMPSKGEGLDAMEKYGVQDWDGTPLLHGCQLAKSEVAQESDSSHLAGYSDSALTWLLQSPLLWVDGNGSRFVNEDVVYDTAFWANAAYAAGGRYFIIVDQTTLDCYTAGQTLRMSNCGPGPSAQGGNLTALTEQAVAGKTAWKGATISELAAAANLDAQILTESVNRYNILVEQGKDTDFNKAPASLKFAVRSGPYYAFDCRAVYLGTIGGVKVDQYLRVLNVTTYKPVPGLFAAGACAGGYYAGKGYPPFEGLACGFAWTSGRIAGDSAVRYIQGRH